MPIIVLRGKKATAEQLEKMSYEYGSYIKVVVDVTKGILAGGGEIHYDEERVLLDYGCEQENLWGGGVDLKTGEIDYNSMINLRPKQNNPSRDILSQEVREKMDKIIKELVLNE